MVCQVLKLAERKTSIAEDLYALPDKILGMVACLFSSRCLHKCRCCVYFVMNLIVRISDVGWPNLGLYRNSGAPKKSKSSLEKSMEQSKNHQGILRVPDLDLYPKIPRAQHHGEASIKTIKSKMTRPSTATFVTSEKCFVFL